MLRSFKLAGLAPRSQLFTTGRSRVAAASSRHLSSISEPSGKSRSFTDYLWAISVPAVLAFVATNLTLTQQQQQRDLRDAEAENREWRKYFTSVEKQTEREQASSEAAAKAAAAASKPAVVPTTAVPVSTPASPPPAAQQSSPLPPVTPASTPVTVASDRTKEDEEDDEAAFEAEWDRRHASAEEREFSAPAHQFPSRPHVSALVASDIPQRIDHRDSDVLLQIYAPWCGACKMQQPVIDTTAKVLNAVQAQSSTAAASVSSAASPLPSTAVAPVPAQSPSGVRVLVMDGEANVLPGFLNAHENRALPLLKFFPRCGSKRYPDSVRSLPACQPVLFEGECNVEHLLEFVHHKASEQPTDVAAASSRVFDLVAAHQLARMEEPATRERVAAAIVTRMNKDFEAMPAQKLYELAPCGPLLTSVMRHFMSSSYASYVTPGDAESKGHELFEQMRVCQEKEAKRIDQFWEQVSTQAEEAKERKKQSAQAEQ